MAAIVVIDYAGKLEGCPQGPNNTAKMSLDFYTQKIRFLIDFL